MVGLNETSFNKGVDEVLTLSPLRRAFVKAVHDFGKTLEDMPTMHEMNMNFINKLRKLGRF